MVVASIGGTLASFMNALLSCCPGWAGAPDYAGTRGGAKPRVWKDAVRRPRSERRWLVDRSVLDREARRAHARERRVEIVDLDREIGHRRARAALRCDADLHVHLRGGDVGRDPAVIHQQREPEHVLIEALGRSDIRRREV